MSSKRVPALGRAPNAAAARVPKTRRPAAPPRMRRALEYIYEEDDTFEVPESALGGTKE